MHILVIPTASAPYGRVTGFGLYPVVELVYDASWHAWGRLFFFEGLEFGGNDHVFYQVDDDRYFERGKRV
jgi:hypothetical protein